MNFHRNNQYAPTRASEHIVHIQTDGRGLHDDDDNLKNDGYMRKNGGFRTGRVTRLVNESGRGSAIFHASVINDR